MIFSLHAADQGANQQGANKPAGGRSSTLQSAAVHADGCVTTAHAPGHSTRTWPLKAATFPDKMTDMLTCIHAHNQYGQHLHLPWHQVLSHRKQRGCRARAFDRRNAPTSPAHNCSTQAQTHHTCRSTHSIQPILHPAQHTTPGLVGPSGRADQTRLAPAQAPNLTAATQQHLQQPAHISPIANVPWPQLQLSSRRPPHHARKPSSHTPTEPPSQTTRQIGPSPGPWPETRGP